MKIAVTNSRGIAVLGGALLMSLTTQIQGSVAEPQYPPTIQAPVVGETIIAPIAPKTENAVVVVPKATSNNIPVVDDVKPVTLAKSTIKANTTLKAPEVPVQVATSLLLGGVTKEEISQVPTAQVSSKKSTELQVPSDVPTRISVTALPKATTVQVKVVIGGKTITLGNLKTDSAGKIILPPLTLTDKGKTVTVQVVAAGKTTKFNVRSTK